MDNVNAGVAGRERLNGVTKPASDLLKIDIFDGGKSMPAKNRCYAGRLETADRTFSHLIKLFVPLFF